MKSIKETMLKLAVQKETYAFKLRTMLLNREGSVTSDMAIWIMILGALGFVIVKWVVPYVQNQGLPMVTKRLEDTMNYS